ncbi:MAG: hypothetical protein OXU61_00750 [Gammaproteobacteria bacterium]|nr:hypothetical protein [Gammaproteobacteria bacterium]
MTALAAAGSCTGPCACRRFFGKICRYAFRQEKRPERQAVEMEEP